MSAPDPKKWELTQDELDTIESGVDVYGVESGEVTAPVYAVARRRALEELRALLTKQQVFSDNAEWDAVESRDIIDRIAEIEAEAE